MSVAWIDIHKIGAPVYTDDGQVDITGDYAKTMMANFYACKKRGYAVPVLRNHGREDAWIYGDVVDMRIDGEFLQASVEFTSEDAKAAFNDGRMREFSPGFDTDWMDPHTGDRMGPTLLELSFTGLAYQRNLRQPQEAHPVQLSRYLHMFSNKEMPMADEEMPTEMSVEERMVALEEAVASILAKLEPSEQMMEDAEEEMMVEDNEKEEMSRRIQQLEDQLVRKDIEAAGIKEDIDSLVKLARVDRKLFASTVKKLSRSTEEIGVMGVAQTSSTVTVEDVARAAKAAKQTGPGRLALFLSSHHPTFVSKISEVRKHI